ncbi:septum formation protein Maf [Candidatus Bathyarchaeota archaeon]|nr:septum formation protein Maf [Candidatus Bathyarchaeota archaeon]MBS7617113.1 septum formation protein Maf [Candidatus Bathyarchaeota archaeon]
MYLASKSERRICILQKLGLEFKPKEAEELNKEFKCSVVPNALSKAWSGSDMVDYGCIAAADTVVVLDGRILGKPESYEDAKRMLEMLNGRWHVVATGLAVILTPERLQFTSVEETDVKFKTLTDRGIEFYLSTDEPFDKAGAYGIQGYASLFVERIEGRFFNVVGLPVRALYGLLKKAGIDLLDYICLKSS